MGVQRYWKQPCKGMFEKHKTGIFFSFKALFCPFIFWKYVERTYPQSSYEGESIVAIEIGQAASFGRFHFHWPISLKGMREL